MPSAAVTANLWRWPHPISGTVEGTSYESAALTLTAFLGGRVDGRGYVFFSPPLPIELVALARSGQLPILAASGLKILSTRTGRLIPQGKSGAAEIVARTGEVNA